MSLVTNLQDLATRAGTEDKALRTLINGNVADLSSLDTTAKSNLVAAINEVVGAVAGASGIDDGQISTTTSWSSQKTSDEIGEVSDALDAGLAGKVDTSDARLSDQRVPTDNSVTNAKVPSNAAISVDKTADGTTNKVFTAVEKTKLSGIATGSTANQTDAYLLDLANSTGEIPTTQVTDFAAEVNDLISATLDIENAPALLNSINELAAALGDDPAFGTTVTTALANRVRVDAAQAFNGTQQTQARTNIGAASATDVGDVSSSSPVTAFENALI